MRQGNRSKVDASAANNDSTITIGTAMTYITVVKVHTGQRGLTATLLVTSGRLIALMSASCLDDK